MDGGRAVELHWLEQKFLHFASWPLLYFAESLMRMSGQAKRWISRLIKLVFCAGALWYLSGKVTLNDYARLAENPAKKYLLISRDAQGLELEDPDTGKRMTVPYSALAAREKNRREIEPGLKSIFRSADHSWSLWGLLLYGPVTFLISW